MKKSLQSEWKKSSVLSMKNLLSIGFVIVLLVQPLFGFETASSEGQERTIFSAFEFKKKTLLMNGDICDIQVNKHHLIDEYITSWDNNFYIQFSGDDVFLKAINVIVSSDGVTINEDCLSFYAGIRELQQRAGGAEENPWSFDGNDFFLQSKSGKEYVESPKVKIYVPAKCNIQPGLEGVEGLGDEPKELKENLKEDVKQIKEKIGNEYKRAKKKLKKNLKKYL